MLRQIDLAVAAGETVAFVGPSGAGKTTLCSLLPRFYEPSAGRITVDGTDIRAITLASLRGQIGIVQQDVFLFGGTLRENIAYGRLDATEADILQAARRAQLADVIAAMPAGLDTVVGERGVKLSGGQKQRLAIARMFLKNPPILILDEATSALDTETEQAVQRALAELARGRTTLVIAHRLATIRNADRIVVVDAAGVAEQGRHGDLLAAGGTYRRLHAAQYGRRWHDGVVGSRTALAALGGAATRGAGAGAARRRSPPRRRRRPPSRNRSRRQGPLRLRPPGSTGARSTTSISSRTSTSRPCARCASSWRRWSRRGSRRSPS